MKRAFFLLFLACAASFAPAQNILFQVGGGLAAHYKDSKPVGCYKIGVAYEHEFDQAWSFSPGLYFSGKGWRNKDVNVTYDDDIDPESGLSRVGKMGCSTRQLFVGINLPFNYYLRTGEGHYVVFTAGTFLAYGVGGKRTIEGDPMFTGADRMRYTQKTYDVEGMKRFDCGILLGVGYQFRNGITASLETELSTAKTFENARNVCGYISLSYNFHQAGNARERRRAGL